MNTASDWIVQIPAMSQIETNLYMGAIVDAYPFNIQFVVNLCRFGSAEAPKRYNHQVVTHAPLIDGPEIPDLRLLQMLANHVNRCRDIGPTLVHCRAGLNRSGLVMALALIERGMPAPHAIALLRERRSSEVLKNPFFEKWLLTHA